MKKIKKPTVQEARRAKAATAASDALNTDGNNESPGRSDKSTPHASTPIKQAKMKEINRQTSPEAILEVFQNQDMTRGEWEKMADQVLTRGIQKTAEDILTSRDAEQSDDDVHMDTPPGCSDESSKDEHQGSIAQIRRSNRQTKNQGPKRYGDPAQHSVRLICSEEDLTDLNKAALEAYRLKLARLKTDTNKLAETKLGILERHLFRKKFGYASLDVTRSWNASWWVPLKFYFPKKEREAT